MKSSISDKKITHIIFDMDRTLLDSWHVWHEAERGLFRHLGSDFREDIAAKYNGMNCAGVAKVVCEEMGLPRSRHDECADILRSILLRESSAQVKPMPGAAELLARLKGRYPLALASGSPLSVIEALLDAQGWRPYFQVVLSSEEVERGKPAPDVFLEAARRLGAEPGECLVVEDAINGARAAQAAGMTCYLVPSSPLGEECEGAKIFASLDEISLE